MGFCSLCAENITMGIKLPRYFPHSWEDILLFYYFISNNEKQDLPESTPKLKFYYDERTMQVPFRLHSLPLPVWGSLLERVARTESSGFKAVAFYATDLMALMKEQLVLRSWDDLPLKFSYTACRRRIGRTRGWNQERDHPRIPTVTNELSQPSLTATDFM